MSDPEPKHGEQGHDGGHDPGGDEQAGDNEHHGHGIGRHGMLVVGLESIFVSHLPMFTPDHGVQLILEVDFEGADDYRRKRRETRGPIYTLNPAEKEFSWRELVPDGSHPPRKKSFVAEIFSGHFERGGEVFLRGEEIKVLDVTYVHELSVSEDPARHLTYRRVGRGDDRLLAHEIHGPPTFDQVLSFEFTEPAFSKLVRTGAPVQIRDRPDEPEQRLRAGDAVFANFFQSLGPEGQHGFSTEITVTDEGYVEIDELIPRPPKK